MCLHPVKLESSAASEEPEVFVDGTERGISSLGGRLNAEGALLSLCRTIICVDIVQTGLPTFPKDTQQKGFCCIISKGLKFRREEILFSSRLHNGAFREPLLKGIATAFVWKGVSVGRVC